MSDILSYIEFQIFCSLIKKSCKREKERKIEREVRKHRQPKLEN